MLANGLWSVQSRILHRQALGWQLIGMNREGADERGEGARI